MPIDWMLPKPCDVHKGTEGLRHYVEELKKAKGEGDIGILNVQNFHLYLNLDNFQEPYEKDKFDYLKDLCEVLDGIFPLISKKTTVHASSNVNIFYTYATVKKILEVEYKCPTLIKKYSEIKLCYIDKNISGYSKNNERMYAIFPTLLQKMVDETSAKCGAYAASKPLEDELAIKNAEIARLEAQIAELSAARDIADVDMPATPVKQGLGSGGRPAGSKGDEGDKPVGGRVVKASSKAKNSPGFVAAVKKKDAGLKLKARKSLGFAGAVAAEPPAKQGGGVGSPG